MKLKTLFKDINISAKNSIQKVRELMARYGEVDCVLGYYKANQYLIIAIIKSQRSFYAIRYVDTRIARYVTQFIIKVNQTDAATIIKESGEIIDPEGWQRFIEHVISIRV